MFYDYFPSKDDLPYANLRHVAAQDPAAVRAEAQMGRTARERFLAPLQMLIPWFESSDYREPWPVKRALEAVEGMLA